MRKELAARIAAQAQKDRRIRAQVVKAGRGFRVRLVLRPGTTNQREITIGKEQDLPLTLSLWEGW